MVIYFFKFYLLKYKNKCNKTNKNYIQTKKLPRMHLQFDWKIKKNRLDKNKVKSQIIPLYTTIKIR